MEIVKNKMTSSLRDISLTFYYEIIVKSCEEQGTLVVIVTHNSQSMLIGFEYNKSR